jgi:hypothetical protein
MEEMNMPIPAEKPKAFVGRGGMTINVRGDERLLAFWPAELSDRGVDSYVGKAFRLYSESMRIAQRHHQQNRKVIESKAARREVQLPEPSVRSSLARAEQRRLTELQAELKEIEHRAFMQRSSLAPFDYPANDLGDVFRRQELRSLLREVPQADRLKLVQKHEYRRAMLEMPCEVSAMPPSEYQRLREAELLAKHPDIIEGTTQAAEACRITSRVLQTATEAVTNELLSVGQPVREAERTAEPTAWVQ